MTEQIGKITLDYKYYPGEDFYCDGVIEDELLEIVKNNPVSEYSRIIEERASWPILYHLSPLRENIVDWVPVDASMKVLEVGSGCGAITGALARKAKSVTCIDLSKKRSTINAYRHQECDNVTIHVGNFKDIEPELPEDYDYIFLIGVFEYGQGYMGTNTPYEDFMAILKKHMSPKGRLVIAIENKFGLKYWAGCKEDHFGTYFSGIEDYPEGGGVRTFTRRGLEKIMKANDMEEYSFYYPYPDYKFMTTVFSDAYLPRVGELSNNLRNFDRDRLCLFDEKNAFDNVIREGAFAEFSNSYLVVIGEPLSIKYSKFSNDRAEEYAIRTDILQDDQQNRSVYKSPLNEKAVAHIQNIRTAYEKLTERFTGSKFQVNRCILQGNKMELEYLKGKTLEMLLDECLDRGDEVQFRALVEEYEEALKYHDDMPVTDYDLIFSNIIVEEESGQWTILDYEWTFATKVSYEKNLFRALYCYLIGATKRRKLSFDLIKEKLGIDEENCEDYVQRELDFQHYVTGQRLSMTELRNKIGMQMIPAQALADRFTNERAIANQKQVQIYTDCGEGFCEENSYFLTNAECMEAETDKASKHLSTIITIADTTKRVRLDPAMEACIVKIQSIQINGQACKQYQSNGKIINEDTIVFATADPNITIEVGKYAVHRGENKNLDTKLQVELEIIPITMDIAESLQKGMEKGMIKKKLFNR